MSTPIPSAPLASSVPSRSSHRASSAGEDERCHPGSLMTVNPVSNDASGIMPNNTWARAAPHEAEKPKFSGLPDLAASAYARSIGIRPASRSSAVVTPSIACSR
jgi:hypothetical protein